MWGVKRWAGKAVVRRAWSVLKHKRSKRELSFTPAPPPPLPMLLQIKGKEVCDLTTEVSNLASAGIFCMARDV